MSIFSSMSPTAAATTISPPSGCCSLSTISPADTSPSMTAIVGVSWSYVDPTATQAFLGQRNMQFPSVPSSDKELCISGVATEIRHATTTPCSDDGQSVSEDSTADGMTPTPSGKGAQFSKHCHSGSSDSLSDLLDDLDACLPIGFDIEDLDAEEEAASLAAYSSRQSSVTTSSSTQESVAAAKLLFKNPAEASMYLKAPRSDIDMEVQRCLRTYEKSETLSAAVQEWQKEGLLTEEHRLISLKLLIHEAGNRCLGSLKHRSFGNTPAADTPRHSLRAIDATGEVATTTPMTGTFLGETYQQAKVRTYSSWKTVEENVISDHAMYGYQTPQRHLSCMCIFNPTMTDTSTLALKATPAPLPCPYGENDDDRSQRSIKQAALLQIIKIQHTAASTHPRTAPPTDSLFLQPGSTTTHKPRMMRPVPSWTTTQGRYSSM